MYLTHFKFWAPRFSVMEDSRMAHLCLRRGGWTTYSLHIRVHSSKHSTLRTADKDNGCTTERRFIRIWTTVAAGRSCRWVSRPVWLHLTVYFLFSFGHVFDRWILHTCWRLFTLFYFWTSLTAFHYIRYLLLLHDCSRIFSTFTLFLAFRRWCTGSGPAACRRRCQSQLFGWGKKKKPIPFFY